MNDECDEEMYLGGDKYVLNSIRELKTLVFFVGIMVSSTTR